jgi:hypothetical protein
VGLLTLIFEVVFALVLALALEVFLPLKCHPERSEGPLPRLKSSEQFQGHLFVRRALALV